MRESEYILQGARQHLAILALYIFNDIKEKQRHREVQREHQFINFNEER